MTDPTVPPSVTPPSPPPALATRLADGEWHRLHPATPLLRGGIALIAILGVILSNLREKLFGLVAGGPVDDNGDPVDFIVNGGYVPLALLAIAVVLIVIVAMFYFSWRVHTFRITDELVEVRSGLIIRTNRKGRLDRIQGINIVRPFFARLFGAARLEIDVAGHDANVRLDYLSSSNADGLRLDILRLASGTRRREAAATADTRGLVDQRVSELIAPELDPHAVPPESVVKLHTGRLIGSIVLHDTTLFFLIVIIGAAVVSAATGHFFAAFFVLPFLFGLGSFITRRFTKSLRYTIAGTPDGVRVGFGLLTLSNETLPPGRIHSIQVRQPLLWRLPGWWEIRVNRASKSSAKGAEGQRNTTILPVGNLDDVIRVLALVIPGLVDENSANALRSGIVSTGDDGGFINSPRRAAIVRWFSWRRNGFAFLPGVVLLRTGAIWRDLTIVPEPRVQSIALRQGPIYRRLHLAHLDLHTVVGPIRAELGAVDRDVALRFFSEVSLQVVQSVNSDATHQWRSNEAVT
ncbi:MAG: putative rane protein [Actinomycetota bacterium]|nr:putative rane protein [Actinomycetota bacterium]